MNYLWGLFSNVARIVFLRGSPERIYYTRRLFIAALFIALAASAGAQALFFGDHLVFVLLRVFAEVTMFMIMVVLLTAKIPRIRLARMMLALVLISLFADSVLIILSVFPLGESAQYVAYAVGGVAIYGASNCLAWALNSGFAKGLGYLALYVAASIGLDTGFRTLYEIMAGAGSA